MDQFNNIKTFIMNIVYPPKFPYHTYEMYTKEHDQFLKAIRAALLLPIRPRCEELTMLLDRANLLDLHNFFPVLIDHIFGLSSFSWGLRTISENLSKDFQPLHTFLGPCGPLFKVIYRLLRDSNTKYEYPLTCLPTKVKMFLESTCTHPFYGELLYQNPQSKQITSLLLNPFDFYMFHFAYHLINPWQQRVGSAWNTIYYVLSCDYIMHFLPVSPGAPILPEVSCYGKTTSQPTQTHTDFQMNCSILNTSTIHSLHANDNAGGLFHKNLDKHPRNEIWRSETVLTIFVDMWLHNDQLSYTVDTSFNYAPPANRLLHYNELPTGEYMRIVRVLVKQLHKFSDSAKIDDTHLCELKKIAIPMIEGKFYVFLRNLIHRWPLDGSFRLVLELWLSFIQPWRYQARSLMSSPRSEYSLDLEDITLSSNFSVDEEYLPFIAENLLSYVVIFQQILPRFCRVDLISPKVALMLYRITKVFDQPNLPNFIREIERCVENNNSPSHKFSTQFGPSLPPLSPTAKWCTNILNDDQVVFTPDHNSTSFLNNSVASSADKRWSVLVRKKIFELEGHTFCYKNLFSEPAAPEVYDLISQIKRALFYARLEVEKKQKQEAEVPTFWESIKSFFNAKSPEDEITLTERRKVPAYLEVSMQNLLDMFQISDYNDNGQDMQNGYENYNSSECLTPERVKLMRISKLKYDGDPDLIPIGDYEIGFLVRILYQICLKINTEFGPKFYRMYHAPSFTGRLTRQLLRPPITIYNYDKTVAGSPRIATHLPPRMSLRLLANKQLIGYFVVVAVIAWYFGCPFVAYVLLVAGLFFLYKCIKAIPNSALPVRHNYPIQGFGNISFNDSF